MTPLTLSDAQIRDAFDRRARAAVPSDFRGAVLAAIAAEPQRWSWVARAGEAFGRTPTRRAIVVLAAVALLIAATVAIALVGSHDQPLPGAGRGLAFISGGDLWVADIDGANPRLALDTQGAFAASRPLWIDPETIVIQEFNGGVYAVNLQTSTARLLADAGWLLAISPDHRRVAIGVNRQDVPHDSIVQIANGAQVADLLVHTGPVPPGDPQIGAMDTTIAPHAWSPDGRWLLGGGSSSASGNLIYQLDVETGETHALASGLCCGLHQPHPVLAPDGSSVVYVDYHQAGKGELCDFRCGTLWSLDPVTGIRRQLTADAGSEIGPVFSPDGTWIAFAEYVGAGYDISIVRSDGTGRRRVTSIGDVFAPAANLDPYVYIAWDADGSGLTFMRGSLDQAEYQLWHVTVDGLQLERLGTITASEFAR